MARPPFPGNVIVSEIHYHPAAEEPGEFLEIANVTDHAVNLRGARFAEGIGPSFSDTFDTVLASGQRLLLVGASSPSSKPTASTFGGSAFTRQSRQRRESRP